MSGAARLPVHAIDASRTYLVALTGANIVLVNRHTGELLASLDARIDTGTPGDAAHAAFPRLCALSPSEAYVAVASDDKTLRVWRVSAMEYGKEVVLQRLAKRAGTLQWTAGADAEEVVVADKFGDVWAFAVDPAHVPAALPEKAEEDPAEAAIKPCLGHVSMVTCLAFLGAPGAVPASIVSADRDEHIRISRWGKRRAGHVVQQYLMGSKKFVGALLPLPASPWGENALVSADGGTCLRVWTQAGGTYRLHAAVTLDAARLTPYVGVDATVERLRERAATTLGTAAPFDPSVRPTGKRSQDEEADATDPSPLVMTRLALVGDDTLLVAWEGASVLGLLPLSALQSSGEVDSQLTLTEVDAPILRVAYVEDGAVYIACDDRPGLGKAPALRAFAVEGARLVPAALPSTPLMDALSGAVAPDDVPTSTPAPSKHEVLTAVPATPRAFGMSLPLTQLRSRRCRNSRCTPH